MCADLRVRQKSLDADRNKARETEMFLSCISQLPAIQGVWLEVIH